MPNTLFINDFKCFNKQKLNFGALTIIVGPNSSGKSTIVQSLLLSRIAFQNYVRLGHLDRVRVPLNGPFLLELGNTLEIVRRTKKIEDSTFLIEFTSESGSYLKIKFNGDRTNKNTFHLGLSDLLYSGELNLTRPEFYYLSAERIGPRLSYLFEPQNYFHAGWRGERTFQLLSDENLPIDVSRCFKEKEPIKTLFYQARKWLEYIVPGSNFDNAVHIGKSRIIEGTFSESMPPNVGFGISYVLPIILNGLLAVPKSMFIVENPEAHLHPSGQSRIARFLTQVAASGVDVIVETHSEHFLNGVRIATLEGDKLPTDKVVTNFVSKEPTKSPIVEEVKINENADFDEYPPGFIDQEQRDIAEMVRLIKSKNQRHAS